MRHSACRCIRVYFSTVPCASDRSETHRLAAEKEKRNEVVKGAFGIRSDFVEGSSFDRDLQEQKKLERKVCAIGKAACADQ